MVARVEPAAPPRRRQDPAGRRRRRRRRPLQICCGAFNMAVGDLVPLATVGTTMPSGMEIGRRKLRGQLSNGMLCSAASWVSATTTPASASSRRRDAGHAARRCARHRARRPLRPRDQPQPSRRHVGRRAGPRPRPPARPAVHPAVAQGRPTRRSGRRGGHGRDRSTPTSAGGSAPGAPRRHGRARRPTGCNAACSRSACGRSTRRRRLELRDARARPAEPPLRPRPRAGRRPRVRRAREGESS